MANIQTKYRRDAYDSGKMSDDQLQSAASYRFPRAKQRRMDELLDKGNAGKLDIKERRELDKLVNEFEERTLQKTLAKAELVELLMRRLQPQLKTQLENWLEIQLLETIVHQTASNPFAVRYSDYTRLSGDEERELQEKIYMENYAWIESELDRRKAEWMIVINGRVVKSSSTLDKIPSKPQLDRLGKKRGFVPFLFVRNIPIEETELSLKILLDGQNRTTEIVE